MTETPRPDGVTRQMSFHDVQRPEQLQAQLERHLMVPLAPETSNGRLVYKAAPKVIGTPYRISLSFDAAFPRRNRYTFRADASWAGSNPANLEYERHSALAWFKHWTGEFEPHSTYSSDPGSNELYLRLQEQALAAETELASIETTQRRILDGLRAGGEFTTSHKEGGSRILYMVDRFLYSTYGESNDQRVFTTDAGFLAFLRQYYDSEASRHTYPGKPTEAIAWRLILRLLRKRNAD